MGLSAPRNDGGALNDATYGRRGTSTRSSRERARDLRKGSRSGRITLPIPRHSEGHASGRGISGQEAVHMSIKYATLDREISHLLAEVRNDGCNINNKIHGTSSRRAPMELERSRKKQPFRLRVLVREISRRLHAAFEMTGRFKLRDLWHVISKPSKRARDLVTGSRSVKPICVLRSRDFSAAARRLRNDGAL